jgi:predicted RNA-binding protein with RPS1 domain
VGDRLTGRVGGVKPFGVFVDLPEYGHRVAGMIPREETGQPRNVDLATVFPIGEEVPVEVIGFKDGRIRLRLQGVRPLEEAARPERPEGPRDGGWEGRRESRRARGRERGGGREARGGRAGREEREGGRDERGGGRGGREGPWAERTGGPEERAAGREDRGSRRERPFRRDEGGARHETRREEPEMTTMAIALRKAMERAKERERSSEE